MKLVTFKRTGGTGYRVGELVSDGGISDLTHLASDRDLTACEIIDLLNIDGPFLRSAKSGPRDVTISLDSVTLTAPVPRPGKIICIGLNYRDHAAESNMPIPSTPIIFSKFSSCAIGNGEPVVIPPGSKQTDYEAELAFVIGKRARYVSRENALAHVLGYTNFNDISARDFQFADGQWQRGKSCETFAPMGRFIATKDEVPDPQALAIKLRLNGEVLQDSNTAQMVFGVAELVEFLSQHLTLEPGDIVATGTPPGVGFARKPPVYLRNGDVVEVEIEGLGVLSNAVTTA